MVQHDGFWGAIVPIEVGHEEVGEVFGISFLMPWNGDWLLGELAHNDEGGVKSVLVSGEASEVHRDVLEGVAWYW